MRRINEIIIHCSATRPGQTCTVKDIDAWHRQRGFKSIGYHYVIYKDGTIVRGRPEETVGAHCLGHNAYSIGVCYVGGLDEAGAPADTRTTDQKKSMFWLLKRLKRFYPTAVIHSHRDFAAKDCPCFDATAEYKLID